MENQGGCLGLQLLTEALNSKEAGLREGRNNAFGLEYVEFWIAVRHICKRTYK